MIFGHGDDLYDYNGIEHNFSSNVWQHPNNSGLYRHLADRLPLITNYPEPDAGSLRELIAQTEGIPAKNILLTPGSTSAIYLLARNILPIDGIGVVPPTFSEYKNSSQLYTFLRAKVSNVSRTDFDSYINNASFLWLCNPNNPDGYTIPRNELLKIIKKNHFVTFLLDMAYRDFTDVPMPTAAELLRQKNVVAIYSLTKKYSIPGLRIGYIVAQRRLIASLEKEMMPWHINSLAIDAAKYLITNNVNPNKETILAETQRLRKAINNINGYEALPTSTNFFLVRLNFSNSATIKDYLAREHKILVRDASNFEGLDNSFIRIATQLHDENILLIKALDLFSQQHHNKPWTILRTR